MPHQSAADAVVVGAGAIGLGIAWRAARAGLTVTPAACALVGVDVGEVDALMQAG